MLFKLTDVKRLLTSCLGLGLLPVAPGTWGSLPPAIVFAILTYLHISTQTIEIVMAVFILAGAYICIEFAPKIVSMTGKDDPGEIVADELAGQAVVFLFVPVAAYSYPLITAVAGFILFRLFDILKPWPIRKLEKLPKGWGILADDLLAGVYASLVLLICLKTGLIGQTVSMLSCPDGLLNIVSAGFLGIVQGLTEFLPVSSSGHLVLFEKLLGLNPAKSEMLFFNLAIHLATLFAIFIVFRRSIASFLKNLILFRKYGNTPTEIYRKSPSVHILVLAAVTTAVTGSLGLLFKDYFIESFSSLKTVIVMWIITGTLLLITDFRKKNRLGLRQFGIVSAVIIGLAQTAAIMPGVSRSGATICAAILIGLHRRWAVEYSFLIAIPIISGATIVELVQNFSQLNCGAMPLSVIISGAVTAFVFGIIALKILIKTSRRANLKFFAFYCYILSAFTALYLL